MYWFLIRAVSLLFRVFSAMILIYCILSWFAQPGSMVYTIYRRLEELVEPFIFPFRRITSGFAYRTGIDFAPWLALIALNIVQNVIYIILRTIFL